ncbi:MAG TPA: hypothetical protein VGG56_11600 [Terracidiphilus sp.]
MNVTRMPGTKREIVLDRRIAELESYDMWFVSERIRRNGVVPSSEIEASIAIFKRFAALFAVGYTDLNMPMAFVDEVWHTFILFTEEYANFCSCYLGKFLHHKPITSRTDEQQRATLDFYEVYEEVFGQDLRRAGIEQATCCGGGNDCRAYPEAPATGAVC